MKPLSWIHIYIYIYIYIYAQYVKEISTYKLKGYNATEGVQNGRMHTAENNIELKTYGATGRLSRHCEEDFEVGTSIKLPNS
jgi:hypothetical protein